MSKKSKEEKRNLKSSLLVLLLIAILLIASTYAWFTANRTVTISSLDVNVQASNGLQISTDAVNWKAIISKEDITTNAYSGNSNNIPTSMVPVSTDGSLTSGLLNMYYGTMGPEETDNANKGKYVLTATKTADSDGRYIVFDIFLKADTNMNLTLTTGSSVVATGVDKGLQNASRVAFIKEGHVGTTEAATGALNLMTSDSSATKIWEPNAGSHTQEAVLNDPYGTGISVGDTGSPVTYYGIKAAIDTGILREDINDGTDDTHFGTVSNLVTTNKTMTEQTNFLSIDAGVTKVRIYMWVEGQDVDCDNSASGTNIAYNLQFEAVDAGA